MGLTYWGKVEQMRVLAAARDILEDLKLDSSAVREGIQRLNVEYETGLHQATGEY
jgi:hypothetical protein